MTVIENRVRMHHWIIKYRWKCLQGQCPINVSVLWPVDSGRAFNFPFYVHRFYKLGSKLGWGRVQNLETISAKQEKLGRSYFRAINSRDGSDLGMHWERVSLAIYTPVGLLITQVSLLLTPVSLLFTLVSLRKPSGYLKESTRLVL